MKVLVTGAAGFIGSHLSEALIAQGADVIGIDCFSDYYARKQKERNLEGLRKHPGFQLLENDLADINLGKVLSDVDVVFHEAAQAGVRTSWGKDFDVYIQANIRATQLLLEAAKSSRLDKFIFASSSSVYGDCKRYPVVEDALPNPISPYGVTKLAAEHLSLLYQKAYGIPVVVLRYFTVYGPRQRPDMAFHKFIKSALMDESVEVYGDGSQTRDFTYISDAVAANIQAMQQGAPGRIYNIGGGSRISVKDVIATIEKVLGCKIQVNTTQAQKGDVSHTFADTVRAQEELGYAPKVNIEDGLRYEVQWVKDFYSL